MWLVIKKIIYKKNLCVRDNEKYRIWIPLFLSGEKQTKKKIFQCALEDKWKWWNQEAIYGG